MKRAALLCYIMLFYTCGLVCAEQAFVSHRQHHQTPWVTDLMEHDITIDLGLSVDWGWTNVGAQSPEDPGWYIAWGETESKDTFEWSTYKLCEGTENSMTKYCRNSNFGTCDGISQLEPVDDVAYQKSADAHVPTDAEWQELLHNSEQILTEQDGTMGFLITSLLNGKSIFLPMGGYRSDISYSDDTDGYYWASTYNNCYPTNGQMVHLCNATNNVELSSIARFIGMNVRPVYQKAVPFNPNCAIAVFQNNLSFGNLSTGESKTLSFVIKNVTDKAVTINSLPSSGNTRYGTYSLNWTGGVIDAGKFQKVNVTIKAEDPTEEDNYSFKISYQGMPEGAEITISCTASIYSKDEPSMNCVDLGLPSGTLWADRNVGAVSVSDIGERYAWGETEPKKYYDWGTYSDTQDEGNTFSKYYLDGGLYELAPADDAAASCYGQEWHTPTSAQLQELIDCCDWKVATKASQSGIEIVGMNGNSIFLPDPGSYQDDRQPMVAGSFAYYWTRTLSNTDSQKALSLFFSYSSWSDLDGDSGTNVKPSICSERRCWGQVIRPVYEAAKEERAITVTPSTLDFGCVKVGESKTLSFTVENNTSDSVQVALSVDSIGSFALYWNGGFVGPNQSQIVDVFYTPFAAYDSEEATIHIACDGEHVDTNLSVAIKGCSYAIAQSEAPFVVEPLMFDLGEVPMGQSLSMTFDITNQSTHDETVLDFSSDLQPWLSADWCGGHLAAGEKRTVNLTFLATESLLDTCYMLNIANERMAEDSCAIILLIRVAVIDSLKPEYPIVVSTQIIDFGEVWKGQTKNATLYVTNRSNEDVYVSGFEQGDASLTFDWDGGTLMAGQSRAVHIYYTPQNTGDVTFVNWSLATPSMLSEMASIPIQIRGKAKVDDASSKDRLIIWGKDGSSIAFTLAEAPKLTFHDDILNIQTSHVTDEYQLSNLLRITYADELTDCIEELAETENRNFSQNGEYLTFIADKSELQVSFIAVDGKIVHQFIVHPNDSVSVPLDLFDQGVYVVYVNGESSKLYLR